jgi:hypothetical protein
MVTKYALGDKLLLKIGNRPEMIVTVLSAVTDRQKPHYTVDLAAHGFNELLNTVPIPEQSFIGHAAVKR